MTLQEGPVFTSYRERQNDEQDTELVCCDGCVCHRDNGKALLVEFPDHSTAWVPYSQVHDESEVYEVSGMPGRLVITKWLASQRGWRTW